MQRVLKINTLDARNNQIYKFAAGEGDALALSYTYYNGAVWIMYSNSMNAGYKSYHMEKYEGADHLASEINFGEETVDPDNSESETKYTYNETERLLPVNKKICSFLFINLFQIINSHFNVKSMEARPALTHCFGIRNFIYFMAAFACVIMPITIGIPYPVHCF